MNEKKLKHLEFIQGVITRMANNSFLIKGWAITLVAALFALEDKDEKQGLVFVAAIPVLMFWILDAYFLSQERQYRELYKFVASKDEKDINFDMNASCYKDDKNAWVSCVASVTLAWFYGALAVIVVISWAVLLRIGTCG